ncbi:alpha/beta hydrolase [Streptomyces sp. NPDC052036]|uniref:alpha/beta fold hydrolase n=1 Tax=unclassified Streptomyces TaxID=2593676 RepID=UPI0034449B5D
MRPDEEKQEIRVPTARVNGIRLSYRIRGEGDPLLLIAPAAASAMLWDRHQVPALVRAGYQVVTFDNRGSAPSDVPPGPYVLGDLVADTAALIEELGIGPCRVAGVSIGSMVAQELALERPDLVTAVALLATRGKGDAFRDALALACADLMRSGKDLPDRFAAVATMTQLFGPATLADDRRADDWLTTLSLFPQRSEGWAAQYEATINEDRLPGLRKLSRPALVVAFSHDMIMPPAMGRAVADAIPECRYEELDGCGHFGFLERPDDVNELLVDFFRTAPARAVRPATRQEPPCTTNP